MKNLKLVALTIVFAITGTSFIETKGICKKGQRWDYKKAKCVDEAKSSKKIADEKEAGNKMIADLSIFRPATTNMIYTISNNSDSPWNILNLTFYDKNNKIINPKPIAVYGPGIQIPQNAVTISAYYIDKENDDTKVQAFDHAALKSKTHYQIRNQNNKWILSKNTIKNNLSFPVFLDFMNESSIHLKGQRVKAGETIAIPAETQMVVLSYKSIEDGKLKHSSMYVDGGTSFTIIAFDGDDNNIGFQGVQNY